MIKDRIEYVKSNECNRTVMKFEMTDDARLMIIAKGWTKKYTKREVELILASNSKYSQIEKDKLLYYFNCYNENDEVTYPYGEINERN